MKYTYFIILFLFQISVIAQQTEYVIDPGHTYIGWDVERFLVGEVTGQFEDYTVDISISEENLSNLAFEVVIQAASINSNHKVRDGHLKGEMWLDAETYPEIRFIATAVDHEEDNLYTVTGDFTIHGVTNKVQFPATILGPFKDPTQQVAIGFRADFVIDRFDYNISFNKMMDNGSLFIGKDVKIKIRALAYQKK